MKTLRQYPNSKLWINSHLRKMIRDKLHVFKFGDITDYSEKQREVDQAIKSAKLEHKDKVEQHSISNKMKDAWKGLKLLTGQKEGKKASSMTNAPGSADRLNSLYSLSDNKDYSSIRQSLKNTSLKNK